MKGDNSVTTTLTKGLEAWNAYVPIQPTTIVIGEKHMNTASGDKNIGETRRAAIPETIASLSNKTSSLHEMINLVESRLTPYMSEVPCVPAEASKVSEPQCKVHGELMEIQQSVSLAVQRLSDLMIRLHL